jgi:hypothetical protein
MPRGQGAIFFEIVFKSTPDPCHTEWDAAEIPRTWNVGEVGKGFQIAFEIGLLGVLA